MFRYEWKGKIEEDGELLLVRTFVVGFVDSLIYPGMHFLMDSLIEDMRLSFSRLRGNENYFFSASTKQPNKTISREEMVYIMPFVEFCV